MERLEAYPVTYAILGLLAFWGPLSGYDIKHLFDHMLSTMWGAAQSQIYKELRRMKELGWVEMEREEQEARPDRKIYSITDQGQAALRKWQAQPPEVFQLRDELLLKVLFGTFASPGDLAQHLHTSIVTHEMRLLAYRQNALFLPTRGSLQLKNKRPNPYAVEDAEDPYLRLVVRFAIEFEKTYIRWLYDVLEEIGGDQKPPRHDDKADPQ
ncbi:MAG TPA: PadR family transcriptional regulator [Ktedonobacteraceae bacterium]|nr:PadR family transcriptional regulator [Ktedonobacteraceae bacterium]